MSTQQALVLNKIKELDSLRLEQRPIPAPGPGQLLVKIHAAGLNPLDWHMAILGYFVKETPLILGSDYAGEVVEIGEGVSGFVKGDRM